MQLTCEEVVPGLGCGFVAVGDAGDDVHGAMMAHGSECHSDLMDGMNPEEMRTAGQEMQAHIRQLVENR